MSRATWSLVGVVAVIASTAMAADFTGRIRRIRIRDDTSSSTSFAIVVTSPDGAELTSTQELLVQMAPVTGTTTGQPLPTCARQDSSNPYCTEGPNGQPSMITIRLQRDAPDAVCPRGEGDVSFSAPIAFAGGDGVGYTYGFWVRQPGAPASGMGSGGGARVLLSARVTVEVPPPPRVKPLGALVWDVGGERLVLQLHVDVTGDADNVVDYVSGTVSGLTDSGEAFKFGGSVRSSLCTVNPLRPDFYLRLTIEKVPPASPCPLQYFEIYFTHESHAL
jgi:hypothetical protein